jgi:hypothetical protein
VALVGGLINPDRMNDPNTTTIKNKNKYRKIKMNDK